MGRSRSSLEEEFGELDLYRGHEQEMVFFVVGGGYVSSLFGMRSWSDGR